MTCTARANRSMYSFRQTSRAQRGGIAKANPPCRGPRKSMDQVARLRGSLEKGSSGSCLAMICQTLRISGVVFAMTDMVSSVRHAGTRPLADTVPLVGLNPTMPLYAAGTLPLPAVSVARPTDTRPAPTDTADPEDEPPDMCRLLNTLWGRPYGDRQPERPVASWSRLTLPINSPPASRTCCTAGALDVGVYSYCAQAAVVGIPATSIVSFTENGTP